MKIFKEIFARIWALWALIMFVLTMLVFFIPFLLFSHFKKDPLKTYRFISFSRVWMDIYLVLIGCPLTVRGREYFIPGQNYIVVCNHNSFMDVPVSSPSIPGGNKTIAKVEISKVPLFGLLYKTGSVLVNRTSDTSRKESFNKMKEVLEMGLHMCIYPEGTRNKSDQPLNTFQNGAFRLAKDSGKAIVPALIFNTRKVLPAGKIFYALPHKLRMQFLPPVDSQNETVESLKHKVYEIMREYYEANK